MPRPRKVVLRSRAALFAKTLDAAPTPWISAEWPDPITGAMISIKYRLWVRRRGKALHVETHQESPMWPAIIKVVRLSRGTWYELHRAGMALVGMARWDPSQPPTLPRAIWHPSAAGYELRLEYARTVSTALPRFLNPTRGRPPLKEKTSSTSTAMPIALRGGGRAAARRARRNDLLLLTERMNNLLVPMVERMQDGRRMIGYVAEEQQRLQDMLGEVQHAVRTLRDAVFFDTILPQANIPREVRMPSSLVHGTAAVDLTDIYESMPEPGTVQPTPEAPMLPLPKELEEVFAAAEAAKS